MIRKDKKMDIVTEIKLDDEFSNVFIIRNANEYTLKDDNSFIDTNELRYFFKGYNLDNLQENDIMFYSTYSEEQFYNFKIQIIERQERENLIYLDII
jgi:hypothetical protein